MEALKFSPVAFIVIIVIITIGFYGYHHDDGSYFSYDSISNMCKYLITVGDYGDIVRCNK